MESAELQQLGPEAGLAPLARDRATLPPGHRALKQVGDYILDLTPAGDDLVISFDADEGTRDPARLPWLHKAFRERGLAVLGVKPQRADWYRGQPLLDFFQSEDFAALLQPYRRVLFTGSSMGGFAALTFCTPGSLVLAHSPQVSLDPELVPWETRFPEGAQMDWSGPFARARDGALRAAKVYVTYDPFDMRDCRHVDELDPANLVRLKAPFLGSPLPAFLRRLGILGELVPRILTDRFSAEWWNQAIRKRRDLARYYQLMADRIASPNGASLLLARAWLRSTSEPKTQERIRRRVTARQLGELFEYHLEEEKARNVAGPAGPDEELFRRFMARRA